MKVFLLVVFGTAMTVFVVASLLARAKRTPDDIEMFIDEA